MPSEYDFLLPYSGPARRVGTLTAVGGAFLVGMVCTGLVVALTLKPTEEDKLAAESSRFSLASTESRAAGPAIVAAATPDPAGTAVPAAHQESAKPLPPSTRGVEPTTTGQSKAASEPALKLPVPAVAPEQQAAAPKPEPRTQAATDGRGQARQAAQQQAGQTRACRQGHARAERRRGGEEPREYVDQYGRRQSSCRDNGMTTVGRACAARSAYDRPGAVFGASPYYSRY